MRVLSLTLVGDNLGKRHQHLNNFVNDTFKNNVPFESIQDVMEISTVDRLFKIDLASKYKNVDYIVRTLKDVDLLYVSRALKSTWLIKDPQYHDIINPDHLEGTLYPAMSTAAVNKMKNKIHIYLKDEDRCQAFYEYYYKDNINYALKFLPKCYEQYILQEMENIPDKINAHYLKLLCERTPKAADLYFKKMMKIKKVQALYLNNDEKYLNNIKFLLKSSPETYFYIVESFFVDKPRLNKVATEYILENHKDRYYTKPELYAARLLNLDVLAKYLNNDEIKESVIKLARAEYLGSWFSYKNVEPLLKRMDKKEKSIFVKKIFVNKDIGEKIKEPPYPFPAHPTRVFDGQFSTGAPSDDGPGEGCEECCLKAMACVSKKFCINKRTLLEELFDLYRFDGFPKTFYELKKRLLTESSPNNRMMIMNVLVSKSAGREEQVLALMEHLARRHCNEPSNVRAAVVRSLVRRARVYSLSDECWSLVEVFSRGIEPGDCAQYIHANVIRHALLQRPPSEALSNEFLQVFNTLSEYELTSAERKSVLRYILDLSLRMVRVHLNESKHEEAKTIIWNIFKILKEMKVEVQDHPDVLGVIQSMIRLDKDKSQSILFYLYDNKTCRRLFFKENFNFRQNDDSYLNALRHDATFLASMDKFKQLLTKGNLKHDRFLTKLSIYFDRDLAKHYLLTLEERTLSVMNNKDCVGLGRGICILKGGDAMRLMDEMEARGDGSRALLEALRHNLHLVRPKLDLYALDWERVGIRAANNFLATVSLDSVERLLPKLASTKGRRFTKLTLALSFRALSPEPLVKYLESVKTNECRAVLEPALPYLRRQGDKLSPLVWEHIKGRILGIHLKNKKKITCALMATDGIPSHVRAEYCMVTYKAVRKIGIKPDSEVDFRRLCGLLDGISQSLTKLDINFVMEMIEDFTTEFTNETTWRHKYRYRECQKTFVEILTKTLLPCTTDEMQNERFEKLGRPFLISIRKLWQQYKLGNGRHYPKEMLNIFLRNLKNTKLFMSSDYVSPIPLYEKIIADLKEFLSIEQHFEIYSHLHLTMIYFKSVRQCVDRWPEIVNDVHIKREDTVERLGVIFGRYIAHEIKELISQYFQSVIWVYKDSLVEYINYYFGYGKPKEHFNLSIMKGLLEDKSNHQAIFLAVLLYKESCSEEGVNKKDFEFINEINNNEITFFFKTNLNFAG